MSRPEGTRFRLPEVTYGVIPDTGGVAVLHEMCGPGVVSDMVLTGRVLSAEEALAHGVVSRIVAEDELDATVREIAEQIAAAPAVTVKMAREVIRHLAQPQIRSSMLDEMIYQTFINRSDDVAEMRARAPRSATRATREAEEQQMTEQIGLPAPPPVGETALKPGTFDGVPVFVTGAGTGLGKAIAAEFARLGASIVIASRKDEHLEAGRAAIEALGAPVLAVQCDIREADSVAAAFDAAEKAFGLPGVLVNNAAANFPVPAEDMSPNAWRTVVDITLNGTFLCAREFGRRHLAAGTPGSIINVGASYAWTGGPGFAHSAAAKAGVKNLTETLAVEWGPYGIQVNGLVPGLFPHEDMTADIRSNLDRSNDKDACQPAMRVGERQELGWAATFLASPYGRFISGHTLVVDGANWQRRSLTNPPVVSVRDQMGKGPFDASA